MAKSFASALVGIAIDEGQIKSVDEPVTDYLPELLEKDERFKSITIRHLLTMSSGIKYEEGGDLPWSEEADDTKTYYATELRELALENCRRIEGKPGETSSTTTTTSCGGLDNSSGPPVCRSPASWRRGWEALGMEEEAPGASTVRRAASRRWRAG